MSKKTETNWLQLLLLIGGIFFAIEFIFIDSGLLFLVAIGAIGLYLGKRSYASTTGKTIFWGGAFFLFIAILSTFSIRFLIVVLIVYFVWNWYQNKEKEKNSLPEIIDITEETIYEDHVIKNNWFGKYHTTGKSFAWQDMNIQSFIGDVVVDLNDTMLPKGESVMVIRHLVGNMEIIVPYDVEVTIHHNVVFGDIDVFDHQEKNAFNRSIQLQTKGYHASPQRVKIYTQMVTGKLEVKRG